MNTALAIFLLLVVIVGADMAFERYHHQKFLKRRRRSIAFVAYYHDIIRTYSGNKAASPASGGRKETDIFSEWNFKIDYYKTLNNDTILRLDEHLTEEDMKELKKHVPVNINLYQTF